MDKYHDLIKASHQVNPRCPICSQKYDFQKIQILDESEAGVLSYFKCDKCSASFLATVTETPFGHIAQGLLTDLEAEEVLKFAKHEAITHDDVLEVHEQLEKGSMEFVK
jgi:transposase-like protein